MRNLEDQYRQPSHQRYQQRELNRNLGTMRTSNQIHANLSYHQPMIQLTVSLIVIAFISISLSLFYPSLQYLHQFEFVACTNPRSLALSEKTRKASSKPESINSFCLCLCCNCIKFIPELKASCTFAGSSVPRTA